MATKKTSSRAVKHQEPDKENNLFNKRPPSGSSRLLKHRNSSSLEILEPEASFTVESSLERNLYKEDSGKKNVSAGSVPPRPDSSLLRRTPTPTKQISLQAVRRKEERDDPIVTDIDWKELQSHSRLKGRPENRLSEQMREMRVTDKSSIPFSYPSRHHNCSHHHDKGESIEKEKQEFRKKEFPKASPVKPSRVEESLGAAGGKEYLGAAGGKEYLGAVGGRSSSSSDSSSDDDDDDEEEEERKAPNQLLMEFVTCLMEKDYVNAQKLCTMILMYEPDNTEALTFQPLIEEKISLDQEPDYDTSDDSEDEERDYDDDDDDDDDDDSDDSEDSDSDSSDSDSDEDEEYENFKRRLDSGIASAACSD